MLKITHIMEFIPGFHPYVPEASFRTRCITKINNWLGIASTLFQRAYSIARHWHDQIRG